MAIDEIAGAALEEDEAGIGAEDGIRRAAGQRIDVRLRGAGVADAFDGVPVDITGIKLVSRDGAEIISQVRGEALEDYRPRVGAEDGIDGRAVGRVDERCSICVLRASAGAHQESTPRPQPIIPDEDICPSISVENTFFRGIQFVANHVELRGKTNQFSVSA